MESSNNKLTVFIHGYNNTFVDAFRRGAAISSLYEEEVSEDQKDPAAEPPQFPVVVIHWPSRARLLRYTLDEAAINWAQHSIEQRLAELTTVSEDITVIAHSMGTRAAIRSILALDRIKKVKVPGEEQLQDVEPDNIKRIVLASGDVDRDAVLRKGGSIDLLIKREPWNERLDEQKDNRRDILIYSSFRDLPIQVSRRLHGYDRLGSTTCRYDILLPKRARGTRGDCHLTTERDGLAVVSTSTIDGEDKLNHADFLDDCSTRTHLAAFLTGGDTKPYVKRLSREGETSTNPGVMVTLSGFEIIPNSATDCDL